MDVVLLSRLQFALTVMFHYIFPPLTIGLGIILAYLETKHYFTKEKIYAMASQFWTKIFVLNFGIGVASGIVMEFQFGTNWASYSRFVGDVFGSALAAEGIFAFFLESGFLAVVAFGREKVRAGFYLFSVYMVSLGSIFSSIWIVVANSWQQTPTGHHIVDIVRPATLADGSTGMVPWIIDGVVQRRAEIVDFLEMVLNHSTAYRLSHVLLGCLAVGAFQALSISAYYLLKGKHREFAHRSFNGAMVMAFVASFGLAANGHFQAQNVYKYQPVKMAAFEGHFKTGKADLNLIGWPNEEEQKIDFDIGIPGGLSFLMFDDFTFSKSVVGLDRFKEEDRPPLLLTFLSWRVMVGIGSLMILLTGLGLYYIYTKKIEEKRWLLWSFVFAIFFVIVSNHTGWIAAEVGRQPWTVNPPVTWNEAGDDLVVGKDGFVEYDESQGLRTSQSISKAVTLAEAWASIILFAILYLSLTAVWLFILDAKIRKGPEPIVTDPEGSEHGMLRATKERQHATFDSLTEGGVEGETKGGAV